MLDPKYSLTNTWTNKSEYRNLLEMNWNELKFADKNEFFSVMKYLFLNDEMCYGKKYYLNILKEKMFELNLVGKNTSNEDVATEFTKLENKEQLIEQVNFPINSL